MTMDLELWLASQGVAFQLDMQTPPHIMSEPTTLGHCLVANGHTHHPRYSGCVRCSLRLEYHDKLIVFYSTGRCLNRDVVPTPAKGLQWYK